jgi:hypothetical protein
MKLALVVASIYFILIVHPGFCLGQDTLTCRERNLQTMIRKIEVLPNRSPEQSILLHKLKHELQVSRMFRQRQETAQVSGLDSEVLQPASECPGCMEQE